MQFIENYKNRNNKLADVAVEYAKTFLLIPYRYSGQYPPTGLDCSGLMVEILKAFGKVETDMDCDSLYRKFIEVKKAKPGCLAMYGKREDLVHVGMCIDNKHMIEAGGGTRYTKTLEDAEKRNAYVKISRIDRRTDLVCFVDPFLE